MDLQYLAYIRQERNLFVKMILEEFKLSTEQKVRIENLVIAFDSIIEKYRENTELRNLADEVKRMRDAQTAYFAQRTQSHLDAARTLEKKLDKKVKEILKEDKTTTTVQASLF